MSGYRKIALETAVTLDPEILVIPGDRTDGYTSLAEVEKGFYEDPVWQSVRGVRERRIHLLPGRHATSISHHVVKTADDLARILPPASRAAEAPGAQGAQGKRE